MGLAASRQARDVAHLPAWPCLAFSIEVQRGSRLGHIIGPSFDVRPDQIFHCRAGGHQRWVAKRQTQDSTEVLLKLRGVGPLDRPMAAIVNARGHFVDDRCAATGEIFDSQHADMVQSIGDGSGGCDHRGR